MHVRICTYTLVVLMLSLCGCGKQEPAGSASVQSPEAAKAKSGEAKNPSLSSAPSPPSSGNQDSKPAEGERSPAGPRLLDEHHGQIMALAFSADGRTLASASTDKTARLWDVDTGKSKAVFRTQPGEITGVAFLSDGQTLASSGGEKEVGTVKTWEAATGKEKALLGTQKEVSQQLAASPGGKLLAWRDYTDILLWDVERGAVRTTWKGVVANLRSLAFSRDGKKLAAESSGNVFVWDVARPTEEPVKLQPGLTGYVDSLAWNRDGTELAIGNKDKTTEKTAITLWDLATKKPRKTISGLPSGTYAKIRSLAYSPDGKVLAATSGEWLFLFDPATGRELAKAKSPSRQYYDLGCLVFSPDGKILASGASNILLWDVSVLLKPAS